MSVVISHLVCGTCYKSTRILIQSAEMATLGTAEVRRLKSHK